MISQNGIPVQKNFNGLEIIKVRSGTSFLFLIHKLQYNIFNIVRHLSFISASYNFLSDTFLFFQPHSKKERQIKANPQNIMNAL